MRWSSYARASPQASASGQRPCIPSLWTSPVLQRTSVAMKLACWGPDSSKPSSGTNPNILPLILTWRFRGMAMARHTFLKDQSTHPAMYWNWNEAYMQGPKAQLYVINIKTTHPAMFKSREEAATLRPGSWSQQGQSSIRSQFSIKDPMVEHVFVS